jgi:hypothetical protein
MENYNEDNIRYLEAKKRVKRIKGFYIHATVYVLVNLFLIANNVESGMDLSNINNYWTAIFWGVGLLGHGLSIFIPNVILGKDWEEKKIREIMNKNK